MIKQLVTAAALAGATLIPVTTAQAEQPTKATPNPLVTPDLPGCFGDLNATLNHDSGVQDHGKDSKGPGYFFRDGRLFQEARGAFWPSVCGPGAGTA